MCNKQSQKKPTSLDHLLRRKLSIALLVLPNRKTFIVLFYFYFVTLLLALLDFSVPF